MTFPKLSEELQARYEILSSIGQGGMGVVYRARDRTLHRIVCIKFLHTLDATDRGRFRREACNLAKLEHPNIARIFEASTGDDAQPSIVMEFCEGVNLRHQCDREKMAHPYILFVLEGVAKALDFAHAQGIVHRDVKPENIICSGDQVKLCDFGISRTVRVGQTLTQSGVIMGTPDYIAPEQVLEQQCSVRSDQFALGVIAFELFTGRRPFPGESPGEVLRARMSPLSLRPSSVRPELPLALDSIISRAMSLRPDDRFPSCMEFVMELRVALSSPSRHPVTRVSKLLPTVSPPSTTSRKPRRLGAKRMLQVAGVLGVLVAVLIATKLSDKTDVHTSKSTRQTRNLASAEIQLLSEEADLLRRVPSPSAQLAREISVLVSGNPGHGVSKADVARTLLTDRNFDETRRILAELEHFPDLVDRDSSDASWIILTEPVEKLIQSIMKPHERAFSKLKSALVINWASLEEYKRARDASLECLERLARSFSAKQNNDRPGRRFRNRILVELRWLLSMVNNQPMAGAHAVSARATYILGLMECVKDEGSAAPPERLRMRHFELRIGGLLRAAHHTDEELSEQIPHLHRPICSVYHHLVSCTMTGAVTLPDSAVRKLRVQMDAGVKLLCRSFGLVKTMQKRDAREILSGLVFMLDRSSWLEKPGELKKYLSWYDIKHLNQVMSENRDLVPRGSPLNTLAKPGRAEPSSRQRDISARPAPSSINPPSRRTKWPGARRMGPARKLRPSRGRPTAPPRSIQTSVSVQRFGGGVRANSSGW